VLKESGKEPMLPFLCGSSAAILLICFGDNNIKWCAAVNNRVHDTRAIKMKLVWDMRVLVYFVFVVLVVFVVLDGLVFLDVLVGYSR